MNVSSWNKVIVSGAALEHNYRLLRGLVDDRSPVMAMVKSDAYGHGLVEAAGAFARAGCTSFGVAEMNEGVTLREFGCKGDICVLLGFEKGSVEYFFSHRLTPVVFTVEDLRLLAAEAKRRNQKITLFLKFDCGMGRLGFKPAEAAETMKLAADLKYIEIAGAMSHFPCADDRQSDHTRQENADFLDLTESMAQASGIRLIRSISNSGGVLYFPETHGDLVRAGIALYGYYPDGKAGRPGNREEGLRPAMSFKTRVIQVRELSAGSGISYGHTYIAPNDIRLAVLPVGYSDGYPRLLSNRAEVLIRGKRAPIRGRICMNLCMADITAIDGVENGDEAVLLGSQGQEMIDADDLGEWSRTISYELLCSIGNNNERHFE